MFTIRNFDDLYSFNSIPRNTCFEDEGETWVNVPFDEYADRYMVSDWGRTYSIKRHIIMHNYPNDKGYYSANLCKDSHLQRKSISRMVALCFCDEVPDNWQELDVNHKDENPANNTVDNLEWVTHEQNCNYGHHRAERGTAA